MPIKKQLSDYQKAFCAYLRDPENTPKPEGFSEEELELYKDLTFSNFHETLSNAFPILHDIIDEPLWNAIIRDFMKDYQITTPLFFEIPLEFLTYCSQAEKLSSRQLELAHYEWLELACDVASNPVVVNQVGDILTDIPLIAPHVQLGVYEYPVHQMSKENPQPEAEDIPTCIIVYLNRDMEITFKRITPVAAQLIELLQEGDLTGQECLSTMSELMDDNEGKTVAAGVEALNQWREDGIIIGLKRKE